MITAFQAFIFLLDYLFALRYLLHLCYNCVTINFSAMDKATANIYLDNLRPKKSGLCSVKIKITYSRERKYYSTGIDLNPSEFEVIMYGKRKTPEQRAW